jgi:hypothetical protein
VLEVIQEGRLFGGDHARVAVNLRAIVTTLKISIAVHIRAYEDEDAIDAIEDIEDCRIIMKNGVLKQFLAALKSLRNLSIAFPHDEYEYNDQAVDLADAIPHHKTNLETLNLQHFETSERFITDLLQRNIKCLKTLGLHNMYLSPQESRVNILSNLRRDNHFLRSVKFCGELCDSVYVETMDSHNGAFEYGIKDGWDFNNDNKDLSKAREKYMINGGPCPLRHNDKLAVKEGSMDAVAELSPRA